MLRNWSKPMKQNHFFDKSNRIGSSSSIKQLKQWLKREWSHCDWLDEHLSRNSKWHTAPWVFDSLNMKLQQVNCLWKRKWTVLNLNFVTQIIPNWRTSVLRNPTFYLLWIISDARDLIVFCSVSFPSFCYLLLCLRWDFDCQVNYSFFFGRFANDHASTGELTLSKGLQMRKLLLLLLSILFNWISFREPQHRHICALVRSPRIHVVDGERWNVNTPR